MAVFAASVLLLLLLAASPAQAQTGDYINSTTSALVAPGAIPNAGPIRKQANTYTSGAWGTVVGDTAVTITVYYSTDGKNWTGVPVTAISGQGGTGGGFGVAYYLTPKTTY